MGGKGDGDLEMGYFLEYLIVVVIYYAVSRHRH